MPLKFHFEKEKSSIFGKVYRPVAPIGFWSKKIKNWVEALTVVDTGADYTLLPRHTAENLGIDLKKDCQIFETTGVGGVQKVYLLRSWRVKLGKWEKRAPVGFLSSDNVPPLLGRQGFLEDFKVVFEKHTVSFSRSRK